MEIIELLSQDNYLMYNLSIAKNLGIYEAILIGELARKYNYWKANNKLTEDGYFFITREDIERDTGLSSDKQRSAFKHLVDEGVVSCQQKGGIDRSTYYKIINERLSTFLTFQRKETKRSNVKKLDATNTDNTNTINTNTDNTNIDNLSSKEESDSSKSEAKNDLNENSKNYKDILIFINSLDNISKSTKELLISWIESVNLKGSLTIKQLKEKLNRIFLECSKDNVLDEELLKASIEFSTKKGYKAIYKTKYFNSAQKAALMMSSSSSNTTKEVSVLEDVYF